MLQCVSASPVVASRAPLWRGSVSLQGAGRVVWLTGLAALRHAGASWTGGKPAPPASAGGRFATWEGPVCPCVWVLFSSRSSQSTKDSSMCSAVGLVGSECVCVSQASDWSFLTRSSVAGCLCCFTFRLFWKCCERAFAHSGISFGWNACFHLSYTCLGRELLSHRVISLAFEKRLCFEVCL